MNHLVAQVQAGNVGVVFFRSWGADETAQALGMSGGEFNWQYANQFNVVDNGHYITDGVATGQYDLGYTYMTSSPNPGADTTVLATGSDAAALIVHNTWRVAITPFYGHVDGWDDESILATQITERTLQWAAGASVVPLPAAVWLFGSALAGLGWLRRKPV
ncbi:MAG: VPLPA-CTERM sorting domain-containing protein [Gammaproteobacteria bacterium]|nr:VPLPA-CTERM sorting domain-containing protein [Gammaproteobacteria bacterium]NND54456.1 VPLPA-CTERM sorting domain-containing protein [Gammaproteobacteria bacterium]